MHRLAIVVSVLALVAAGCSDASTSNATSKPGSIGGQPSSTAGAAFLGGATPVAAATPGAEVTTNPTTAPKPIVLTGTTSKKTKPFTMVSPAKVELTFSGSGNFIVEIDPVGGDVFSGTSLSNTIGKTTLVTYVYDLELDGVQAYADVLGSGKWSITISPGIPAAKEAPAQFSGKWGLRTSPVHLSGDYTVTYKHSGDGNFIAELVPPDGDVFGGESIANEIGKVSASTEVYGVDGDYYIDVTANGSWTISIAPQT